MRFAGQGYELRVEAPVGAVDDAYVIGLCDRFRSLYESTYGYAEEGLGVEATQWQVSATASDADGRVERRAGFPMADERGGVMPVSRQQAYFPELGDDALVECDVVPRGALSAGGLTGPAVVADDEATTLVPPGCHAHLNAAGDLVIAIPPDRQERSEGTQ